MSKLGYIYSMKCYAQQGKRINLKKLRKDTYKTICKVLNV